MGALALNKEECRDMSHVTLFDDLFRDFQYATRSLCRNPGFATTVNQRTPEIGLRLALGARSRNVLEVVVLEALRLAIIGLAGAFAASRLLTTMLFGVKPADPLTYGAVAARMALITRAASYVPARRAARVDPLSALRHE
jgi:putative ABC transport system permease protein